jgi:hypothetical protein
VGSVRGSAGASLVVVVAACAVVGLGLCLALVPARTTRFLNEAFAVVPAIGGRHRRVQRVVATAIGVALVLVLVLYGEYFAEHVLLGGRILWRHVDTST